MHLNGETFWENYIDDQPLQFGVHLKGWGRNCLPLKVLKSHLSPNRFSGSIWTIGDGSKPCSPSVQTSCYLWMSIFHGFDWLHSHSGIGFQLWPFQRKMYETMDRGFHFSPMIRSRNFLRAASASFPLLTALRRVIVTASHGSTGFQRRLSWQGLGLGEPRHLIDIDLKRTHYKEYIILKYARIYTHHEYDPCYKEVS